MPRDASQGLRLPAGTPQRSHSHTDDAPLDRRWEIVLFSITFVLSLVMLGYAVYRLIWWSAEAGEELGRHGLLRYGPVFLAAVALFSGCRWCLLFSLSVAARHKQWHRNPALEDWPFVTICVPCFNESETIESALDSLLELDYPHYEILVVNDGSSDETLEKAQRYAGRYGGCTVRVLDKPNGGKWSAHNLAFQHAQGELLLCVDADSRLDPPALRTMVARLADPRVAGVAGQMRVRNRKNLITRLQGLEYLMGNGAGRMGQGLFGTVLVVPGPIGLFRRSAMEEVWRRYSRTPERRSGHVAGPFEGDTFAEDFDLSLAILCLGGRIVYEPRAISRTKAPDRQFSLLNQRYRWTRGAIQVLKKLWQRAHHEPELLTPRLLGWILLTYVPELLIMPAIYLFGLGFFILLLVGSSELLPLLGWYGAFFLMQASAGAFFVAVHDDDLSLLHVLPFYGLYNGFVLNSAWAISVFDELRGSRMHW